MDKPGTMYFWENCIPEGHARVINRTKQVVQEDDETAALLEDLEKQERAMWIFEFWILNSVTAITV